MRKQGVGNKVWIIHTDTNTEKLSLGGGLVHLKIIKDYKRKLLFLTHTIKSSITVVHETNCVQCNEKVTSFSKSDNLRQTFYRLANT